MRPTDRLTVRAAALDESGAGVGPAGGRQVHVPDLLPGEAAEVEITHVSPHHPLAWARLVERRGPASPARVPPPCPAFGRCGGCAWQHLAYPAQLEQKRERVRAALRAHGLEVEVEAPVPAPAQLGYRVKGKYVVGLAGERLVLGAYQPRSHEVVDTTGCRVVEPIIDRLAGATRDALGRSGLPVYDERRRRGLLRYVVIRSGADERALVTLVTTSAAPRPELERVADALRADPAVAGVLWLRNDATSATIEVGELEPLAGAATLVEDLAGVSVEVGPLAFVQVNRRQAAALYHAAAEAAGAGPGARAVDLYCGAGGFAFALAARGAEVRGIDSAPQAIAAARHAAAAAGLGDRLRFEHGDAASLADDPGPLDVLIVDPPRKGLSAAVRGIIDARRPPTLVYVSCGPASLARDLAELAGAGYRVERLQPFDLMPGTGQIEVLALCRLRR